MNVAAFRVLSSRQLRLVAWLSAALWTLAVSASGVWNARLLRNAMVEVAEQDARSSFSKDLLYRRWATLHGGVYVPVTAGTPPSPYLTSIPERDIVTPSGRQLTLVNPAYMTRQVHELGQSYGQRGHITSLKLLRPENAPDPWEATALRAFEQGQTEVVSRESVSPGGAPHLRLMRPLFAEAACLKCHASQGYKVGDVRGGLSVAVPLAPYLAMAEARLWPIAGVHAGLWALVMLGISAGVRQARQRLDEQARSEVALSESEAKYRSLVETAQELVWKCDAQGHFTYLNPAWERTHGYRVEEMLGKGFGEFQRPEVYARDSQEFARHLAGGAVREYETEHLAKDGHRLTLLFNAVPLVGPDGTIVGTQGTAIDITERRRAEAERGHLEAELQQARKMESVGRLAGGVAHDFNNLLMGIMNYVELCRDEVPAQHPICGYLDEIAGDARRSADITQQLLGFARKQTIAPRILDLNETVADMLKMLQRLMGEDIALAWVPGAALWPIRMDPGQVNQVMVNLCANARDAIAGVGKVTIETRNVTLDQAYCAAHPGAVPGDHALLIFSDNGCGMSRGVLDHIFEPFFTTKGVGKGTGLGLATVYGIAIQNGGWITVDSEVGKGSTFRIHLPRVVAETGTGPAATSAEELPRGTETALLVEDEKSVRVTTQRVLELLGYTVLVATTPEEAIRLSAAYAGPIHLLITDVIMPGMNGPDLAGRLAEARPAMKGLFISGYPVERSTQRGSLDPAAPFLAKPFGRAHLAHKMREVLDA